MSGANGLRWEAQQEGAEWAYVGDYIIGMVVRQSVGDRLWAYTLDGVHAKWVGKTHGTVRTARSAKAAIERTWAAWLAAARLVPELPTSDASPGR